MDVHSHLLANKRYLQLQQRLSLSQKQHQSETTYQKTPFHYRDFDILYKNTKSKYTEIKKRNKNNIQKHATKRFPRTYPFGETLWKN